MHRKVQRPEIPRLLSEPVCQGVELLRIVFIAKIGFVEKVEAVGVFCVSGHQGLSGGVQEDIEAQPLARF
jgi:hypothetical protein